MASGYDLLPYCPKCGATMTFMIEKERSNGTTKITRYYRCPACGTKVITERLLIKSVNGVIKIIRLTNGVPKIIYGNQRRVVRTRGHRRGRQK